MKTAKYSKPDLISMGPQEAIKARFRPGRAVSNTANANSGFCRSHRGAKCDPGKCLLLSTSVLTEEPSAAMRAGGKVARRSGVLQGDYIFSWDYIRAAEKGLHYRGYI